MALSPASAFILCLSLIISDVKYVSSQIEEDRTIDNAKYVLNLPYDVMYNPESNDSPRRRQPRKRYEMMPIEFRSQNSTTQILQLPYTSDPIERHLLPHPPEIHKSTQTSGGHKGCLNMTESELEDAWIFLGPMVPCAIYVNGNLVVGEDNSVGGSSSGSGGSHGSSSSGGGSSSGSNTSSGSSSGSNSNSSGSNGSDNSSSSGGSGSNSSGNGNDNSSNGSSSNSSSNSDSSSNNDGSNGNSSSSNNGNSSSNSNGNSSSNNGNSSSNNGNSSSNNNGNSSLNNNGNSSSNNNGNSSSNNNGNSSSNNLNDSNGGYYNGGNDNDNEKKNGGDGGNYDDSNGSNSSNSSGGEYYGGDYNDGSGNQGDNNGDNYSNGSNGSNNGGDGDNSNYSGDDDESSSNVEYPLRYFNISDCGTYSNFWVWDLALSCKNTTTLENCECTSAKLLFEYGDLYCPGVSGAPSCPVNCPVCNTCMLLLGCSRENLSDDTVPKPGEEMTNVLIYALGSIGAVIFLALCLYCTQSREPDDDSLRSNLVKGPSELV